MAPQKLRRIFYIFEQLSSHYLKFIRHQTLGSLVGLGRFERPTSPLSGVRSNQLSYRPNLC